MLSDLVSNLGTPQLSEEARRYAVASLRPATRRAYATQISNWLKWHGLMDLAPADPIDIANYLADRAAAGASLSTLRMVVAALKAAHDAKSWAFDSTAPAIGRVLRGVSNMHCRLPRQAEPLTGSVLLDILKGIAEGRPRIQDRRDAALLAAGYVFALRRSELVGLDFEDQMICGDKGLGVLRLRRTTIEVVIARSKTSTGFPEVVSVPRQGNSEAVKAIQTWVAVAAIRTRQPLFWSLTKSGALRNRLSDGAVSAIVKSRVAQHRWDDRSLGYGSLSTDPERFSAHSLRVGFAVTAAECGADLRAIATITRHRSLTMPARYSERADRLRTSPYRLEGVGLEEKG